MTRSWKIVLAVALAAAISLTGYLYWEHQRDYPSTEDAYIGANVVQIAAQVSGPVVALHVTDNQSVVRAEPLFDIDPSSFEIAVQEAEAGLKLARQDLEAAQAAVDAAKAALAEREAQLEEARKHAGRVRELVAKKDLSPSTGDEADAAEKTAQAAVLAAQADLVRSRVNRGTPGEGNARIQAARAALQRAQLDREHTHVVAPADGVVANLSLRPGTMVEAGRSLFALIEGKQWWVDANFKETDLSRIAPGQSADVAVDMYPGVRLPGVVESISRASGSAFSLFPPENTTGNWVKVTQRFPVRVRIAEIDPRHPLRIGSSSGVTIDTVAPAAEGR